MKRLLVLLSALILAVCAVPTADPGTAHAAKKPRIVLGGVTPHAPGPGDTLRVAGTFDNSRGERQPDVSVRLRLLHSPLGSRQQVDQYGTDPDGPVGVPVYGHDAELGNVAAGGASQFRLKVPVKELGLSRFGVYLIAVEAISGYAQVAIQRTFMVYVPKGKAAQPEPTRVSWLWPVADYPHQLLGNTFRDDLLATKLTGGGRLARLVRAGADAFNGPDEIPLTWVIDPNLLDETKEMSDGYRVREAGTKVTGTGSVQASAFLDQVRAATRGGSVLSLPYAGVDTPALARSGLSGDITLAITQGQQITSETLDAEPVRHVAWPPDGLIDQQGLDALAAAGTRTVVLQDKALPLTETLTYTPNPVARTRTASGQVGVLLADHVISKILAKAKKKPGSAVLTEQRFLAETALITAERPNDPRGVVVAPPRRWNPPVGLAEALLHDTATVPWLEPTSLSDQQASASSAELTRQQLSYPKRVKHAELSRDYLDRVHRLHRSLDTFSELFNPLPERIADYNLAALRAESSVWRHHRKKGSALLRSTHRSLQEEKRKVHLIQPSRISLASSEGPVPITIENDLSEKITVRLRVQSANPGRMKLTDVHKSITVPPHQKVTKTPHAKFVATGVVSAYAQLYTVEGTPYGRGTHFSVLSTAYGTVAIAITAGAL
ncbi:MAG: DUF6049 family protein, partial [Streptosporangiales bacterium]